MASYATRNDIVRLYGQTLLDLVAPRYTDPDTNVTTVDEDAIDHALAAASGEIDSYLSGRYNVPLQVAPQHIVQLAIDIAVYRIALGLDIQSAEHRLRYEDAIKYLRDVAANKIGIGIGAADWEEELPVPGKTTSYAFPVRG